VTLGSRGLALVALSLVFLGLVAPAARAEATLAPDFTVPLSDGTNFTLSEHRGKVVVVDFMFLYCPSCGIAEAALKNVWQAYKGNALYADRLEIVSINIIPYPAHTLDMLAAYKVERDFPWAIGLDSGDLNSAAQKYGVLDLVHLVVISPEGYRTWDYVAGIGINACGLASDLSARVSAAFAGTAGSSSWESASVYVLIAIAAVASFFSPCSFPLLPGYMTHYLQLNAKRGGTRSQAALGGSVGGLGIITVYGVVGLVVIAAGAAALAVIPFLQPIVAIVLIALGLLTLSSRQFYFLSIAVEKLRARLFGDKEQSDRFYLSLFSYGAGYGAAGFGCVAAPFIAAVLYATTTGGPVAGAFAFLLYTIIVVALMTALTVGLSMAGTAAVQKLNKYTETIKRISAVVMILAGIYLLYFFWSSRVTVTC